MNICYKLASVGFYEMVFVNQHRHFVTQWAMLLSAAQTICYLIGFSHSWQQAGWQLCWAARLSCPLCQPLASPAADWLGSGGFPLCWKVARWWRVTAGILLPLAPNYNCLAALQHASVFRQAASAGITHPKLIAAQSAKCLCCGSQGGKKKRKKKEVKNPKANPQIFTISS